MATAALLTLELAKLCEMKAYKLRYLSSLELEFGRPDLRYPIAAFSNAFPMMDMR